MNDDLSKLKYFHFVEGAAYKDMNPDSRSSETGYTGEKGFEIFISKEMRFSLERAHRSGRNPPALAPATHCASKPACPCTATNKRRHRPISAEPLALYLEKDS